MPMALSSTAPNSPGNRLAELEERLVGTLPALEQTARRGDGPQLGAAPRRRRQIACASTINRAAERTGSLNLPPTGGRGGRAASRAALASSRHATVGRSALRGSEDLGS